MNKNNWIVIGMLLGAFAIQISGLTQWTEALKPSFVSGMLLAISSVIGAFYSDKPLIFPNVTIKKQ